MSTAPAVPDEGPAPLLRAVLLVFLPFAGGFFLSEVFRSVNALIAPLLIADVRLSPADLGLLTAAYLAPFALFQIPLGLLLDRFGARRVQSMLLLFSALGAFVFALADDLTGLAIGRALIGFGLAGGLMAALKALAQWFPERQWTLVNGCFFALGGLGAVSTTMPLQALLGVADWRDIFLALSAAVLVVSASIFFLVPERPKPGAPVSRAELLAGVRVIYTDRLFWRVAPLAAAGQATFIAVQGLWAGPWLKDVAGLSTDGVARTLLFVALAASAGYVGHGLLAQRLLRLGVSVRTTMGGTLLVFLVSQLLLILELDRSSPWPWLLLGLMGNAAMVAYAYLTASFPVAYAGRINTCFNLIVFGWAFTAQYVVGVIIEAFPTSPGGGYAPEGYRWAFGTLLAAEVLAFLWYLVPLKERRAP